MKRWFGWPAVVAAVAALALVAWGHLNNAYPSARYGKQSDYLKGEIAKVDAEIGELSTLRPKIADFLARKNVAEVLQRNRTLAVRLVDEVTRLRPDGIRFISLRFVHGRLNVEGIAVSERALQRFTSAVAASPQLQAPEGLATQGLEFSFQTALRAAREQ